ncbi:alpha-1,2-fucosyltransferase, partial [Candidatus Roizmanbacteria bacterium CG_4_10_14_3_um_filter_33_21]
YKIMIIANLTGGLGGQMFQYAAGRALSLKLKTPLKLHFTNALFNTQRQYGLDIFNIKANLATDAEIAKLGVIKNQVINRFLYLAQLMNIRLLKNVYTEKLNDEYDPDFFNIPDNFCIQGYFANEKYFKNIETTIRKDFTFKNKLDEKNQKFKDLITKYESVSIHVRRGDYITNKTGPRFIGLDYYIKAIKTISNKIKNPIYFIFSDDIDWVKQNLKLKNKSYFVNNNHGKNSYKDMQLMSLCKHNIIANSTFSWWGSWLNSNKNKIMIKP